MQYARVRQFLVDAEKEGQHIVVGGEVPQDVENTKSYLIKPTIIEHLNDKDRIVVEEQFGILLFIAFLSTPALFNHAPLTRKFQAPSSPSSPSRPKKKSFPASTPRLLA